MNRTTVNFLLIVGFLLTFGAVGGIENGAPLADGLLLSIVGLATIYCGVLGLNVLDSQDY